MPQIRIMVRGAVQGIGFRPFVFRLATECSLAGWIQNNSQGVHIEAAGRPEHLAFFLEHFEQGARSLGIIHEIEVTCLETDVEARGGFEIRASVQDGMRVAWIIPDVATCVDCRCELFNPRDRRFRYPFVNCTRCGPRFSILQQLPFDRANTTMARFRMCAACVREYRDPGDRRFHAQAIACPECGPQLEQWDPAGTVLARCEKALLRTVQAIRQGSIIAVKGLGGFQLLADARNDEAVHRLRIRKRREEKPFALMYPSLEGARPDVEISAAEAIVLESPQAPIVLVRRRKSASIAAGVAPGNPYLGVMLPYTPLHHLVMAELGFPIIATSGNRAEEPIAIDEREAVTRLAGIADLFLTHDRPIARPMDDSVARVVLGHEQVLRRARGYAPLPITLDRTLRPVLAVGGHLKNTVAVAFGADVFLSQHIGDLETVEAQLAFEQATQDLARMYEIKPELVACDLHPDYFSTRFAERSGKPIVRVQHHVAHVLACMAENGIAAPALGVAWDGTGFGTDGTIWGGEFLHVTPRALSRAAHLRPFPLPGGELAMREPRRSALGLLYAWMGDEVFSRADLPILAAFTDAERAMLAVALRRGVNAPVTTSAGRLFDAVAALAGVRHYNRYEGQAAAELEWCADTRQPADPYPMSIMENSGRPMIVDWGPLVCALMADLRAGMDKATASARFHSSMIETIVEVCRRVGEPRVVLTGGCFLNSILLEGAVRRLTEEGLTPYWHQRVPPGDGGIALGQIVAACNGEMQHVPRHSW